MNIKYVNKKNCKIKDDCQPRNRIKIENCFTPNWKRKFNKSWKTR